MTKDQIIKLVKAHGGEDNIYSVINDAGSVIKLAHMDAKSIVFDWDANSLKYSAWDDGYPILICLSLDSLANINFCDTENFDQLKKAIEIAGPGIDDPEPTPPNHEENLPSEEGSHSTPMTPVVPSTPTTSDRVEEPLTPLGPSSAVIPGNTEQPDVDTGHINTEGNSVEVSSAKPLPDATETTLNK
ncbi:hypothetical protein V6O07_02890 [Arthrospira platensis SPKY2]